MATTTDVIPREYSELQKALWSKSFARDLARFLGSEEAAAAFIAEIFNQARRIPALHVCTIDSIQLNVARVAALRLNPALPNMVQFIPRNMKQPKVRESDKDTWAQELTLQYGYAGLRELVMRSPDVKDCFTREVCVNDVFEPPVTLTTPPIHRLPARFQPRGRVEGYFSLIELQNGNWRYLGMSVAEVEAHVKRYVREPGPAWALRDGHRPDVEDGLTTFDKMALKTCLRMQCNGRDVPLTVDVQAALTHEEEVLDRLGHTRAETQGYDRHGNRPALTMSTGVALDELLQDVSGVQDREAVHAAMTQATRRPAQTAERTHVGNAPQAAQDRPGATTAPTPVPEDPGPGLGAARGQKQGSADARPAGTTAGKPRQGAQEGRRGPQGDGRGQNAAGPATPDEEVPAPPEGASPPPPSLAPVGTNLFTAEALEEAGATMRGES